MPLELQRAGAHALAEQEPSRLPAVCGAELVHVAEELYVRVFAVGCALVIGGCGLALSFATLDRGAPGSTTAIFVAVATAFAAAGLARPGPVYRRLRSRSALQVSPAALGALAVLLDGPESECWWIALPLLWIVATLGSTPLAMGAAVATAIAWVVGTVLGGQALITTGDLGVLPATVALPTYTLVGRVLIDGFAGLLLGRHHLPLETRQDAAPPLNVPNLAAAPAAARPAPAMPSPRRRRPQTSSRLTARELEVALLLRDGLHQAEIAACLGISTRQVERLIAAARQRVHAATTTQLVAMLATGALTEEGDRPGG